MNADKIVAYDVIRYDAGKNIFVADKKLTAVEKSFELHLNGEPFREILCSPNDLEDLAIGLLAQADKISSAKDISRLEKKSSVIEVEINSAVQPAPKTFSKVAFVAKDILACADKLLGELSTTHDKTNGVHSGVLFDGQNVFLGDKMIIFSGRCSSEMIRKVARMKVPVVVAKSVPTSYSINLAKKFGITLAGRLTADFFVFTATLRVLC